MDAIIELINQAAQSQNMVALVAGILAALGVIAGIVLKLLGKPVPLLDQVVNLLLAFGKGWKPAAPKPELDKDGKPAKEGIAAVVPIEEGKKGPNP